MYISRKSLSDTITDFISGIFRAMSFLHVNSLCVCILCRVFRYAGNQEIILCFSNDKESLKLCESVSFYSKYLHRSPPPPKKRDPRTMYVKGRSESGHYSHDPGLGIPQCWYSLLDRIRKWALLTWSWSGHTAVLVQFIGAVTDCNIIYRIRKRPLLTWSWSGHTAVLVQFIGPNQKVATTHMILVWAYRSAGTVYWTESESGHYSHDPGLGIPQCWYSLLDRIRKWPLLTWSWSGHTAVLVQFIGANQKVATTHMILVWAYRSAGTVYWTESESGHYSHDPGLGIPQCWYSLLERIRKWPLLTWSWSGHTAVLVQFIGPNQKVATTHMILVWAYRSAGTVYWSSHRFAAVAFQGWQVKSFTE